MEQLPLQPMQQMPLPLQAPLLQQQQQQQHQHQQSHQQPPEQQQQQQQPQQQQQQPQPAAQNVRSKKGKKRGRPPPTSEDYVKVVPLQTQDDHSQPIQASSSPLLQYRTQDGDAALARARAAELGQQEAQPRAHRNCRSREHVGQRRSG